MREKIDTDLLERLLRSYAVLNGFEVRSLIVRGIPDDESQAGGVKVNMLILGAEIPQPELIRTSLMKRFPEAFFLIPEDERAVPDEYEPALYIGSVDGDVSPAAPHHTEHYFFRQGQVLAFKDNWTLRHEPRSARVFYNLVESWNRFFTSTVEPEH